MPHTPIIQLLQHARHIVKSQSLEALSATREARQLAIAQQAYELEAAALCIHAHALLMLGRYDDALCALDGVRALSESHDIGQQKGEALQLLGRTLFERSMYDEASEQWQHCLMLDLHAISTDSRTRAHLGLGLVQLTRERFDIALEHHRMAQSLALESDNHLLHSDAQLHMAADLMKMGRTDDAMTLLKETLPQVRACKSYDMEADIYGLIGEIHLARGEIYKAQTSLMVALKINRLAINLNGETANLIALGLCEMHSKEIDSALEFLKYAQSLVAETGSKRLSARAELALSHIYLAANDHAAAKHAENHARIRAEMLHSSHKPCLGGKLDQL